MDDRSDAMGFDDGPDEEDNTRNRDDYSLGSEEMTTINPKGISRDIQLA